MTRFIAILLLLIGCERSPLAELSPAKIITESTHGTLRAGFSEMSITPPKDRFPAEELYLAGYARGRKATGIHDDLIAAAMALELGNSTVVILTLDVIGIHHSHKTYIQNELIQNHPEVDYVIVQATHNHEAPDTMGLWGEGLRSGIHADYFRWLLQQSIQSGEKALQNLSPSTIRITQTPTHDLGWVKDVRLPEVIPDILTVLEFATQNNHTLAHVVHWHCHPESLGANNTLITSDFPHYVRTHMREYGKAKNVIYWTGVIGGLLTPSKNGSFEIADEMGKAVAKRASEALQKSQQLPIHTLKIAAETFDFPLDNKYFVIGWLLNWFKRPLPSPFAIRSEVATVVLGDLTLQTLPGEVYPELAYGPLMPPPNADFADAPKDLPVLNDLLPGKYKLFLGLAQDELGYIIPKNGWDEEEPLISERGSYGEENSIGSEAARVLHSKITGTASLLQ